MAVTQIEIARELNLSQETVSAALRGDPRCRAATREQVIALARRLGYRRNGLAAGLRGSQTASVGVVWGFAEVWTGDAVIGLDILRLAQQKGLATYQAQRTPEPRAMRRQIQDLILRRVDALIVEAYEGETDDPEILALLAEAPAVISVVARPKTNWVGDQIVHDRTPAIEEIVDHLVATGRRRPAIMLSSHNVNNQIKLEVFSSRLALHGLDHDPLIELPTPTSPLHQEAPDYVERYTAAIQDAREAGKEFDAVFCVNDIGALTVMRVLADRGYRLPEDMAVVGFNDSDMCRLWRPALASVDRRRGAVAEAVAHALSERLADRDASAKEIYVPMRFHRRASAG